MILDRERTPNCISGSLWEGVEMCLCLCNSKATVYSNSYTQQANVEKQRRFFLLLFDTLWWGPGKRGNVNGGVWKSCWEAAGMTCTQVLSYTRVECMLKVPKREIFVTELIILSDPLWIGDLRTKVKNQICMNC